MPRPLPILILTPICLGKATLPLGIAKGRKESIVKIQSLLSNHFNNSKIEHNASWDGNILVSTNFYEIPYGEEFQGKLNEFIWASSNRRNIELIAYEGDSVSLYKSLKFPFKFKPIKIIYHRGCFFVAGTHRCQQAMSGIGYQPGH